MAFDLKKTIRSMSFVQKLGCTLALSLMGWIVFAVAQDPIKGPLEIEADSLTLSMNRAFRAPTQDEDLLKIVKDSRLSLNDPPLLELLPKIKALQKHIEEASVKAQSETKNNTLNDVSNAAPLYFQIQQRLFLNSMRNAHGPDRYHLPKSEYGADGNPINREKMDLPTYSITNDDEFNLHLATDSAFAVAANPQARLEYNLWHDPNAPKADRMILGMTLHDKMLLEQDALHSEMDYFNYGKTVLFSNVISRLENQWAIQRMLVGNFPRPLLQSCGEQFYSFSSGMDEKRDYYSTLQFGDRSRLYNELIPELLKIIFPANLLQDAHVSELLRAQIEMYPASKSDRDSDPKTWNAYYDHTGPEKFKTFFPDHWTKEKALNVLVSAQFPADSWIPEETAKRITTLVIEDQKRSLETFLTDQAIETQMSELLVASDGSKIHPHTENTSTNEAELSPAIDEKIDWGAELKNNVAKGYKLDKNLAFSAMLASPPLSEKEAQLNTSNAYLWKNEAELQKSLESQSGIITVQYKTKQAIRDAKTLVQAMTPKWEASFRANLEAKIVAYLNGKEASAQEQNLRLKRLQRFYDDLEPTLLDAIHAREVNRQVKNLVEKEMKAIGRSDSFSLIGIHPSPDVRLVLSVDHEELARPDYHFNPESSASNGLMAVTPALKHMIDLVYLARPEEVSYLFYQKLAIWGGDASQLTPNSRIKEIEKNPRVMHAMEDFLAELNSQFYETLKELKLDPKQITPENSPLFQIMVPLAKKHAQKFLAKMTPLPIPKSTLTVQMPILMSPVMSVGTAPHSKENDPYPPIEKEEVRKNFASLFTAAMSVIELGSDLAGTPLTGTLQYVGGPANSPYFLEGLLRHQFKEKIPYRKYSLSLLDQYLLSNFIYHQAESRNPALSLQLTPQVDAPSILKVLADAEFKIDEEFNAIQQQNNTLENFLHYPPESAVTIRGTGTKKDRFYKALAAVNKNQKALLEEACSAKTYETSNFNAGTYTKNEVKKFFGASHQDPVQTSFSKIFRASTFVRTTLMTTQPQTKKFDEDWKKATRTDTEKYNQDVIDPVVNLTMTASTVALVFMFAPMVIAGEGVLAATGSLRLALAEASKEVSNAGGLARLLKMLMSSKSTLAMDVSFVLQSHYLSEVAHVTLPDQLAYQTRLANSYIEEVGANSHLIVTHESLKAFAQEVHGQQISADVLKFIAWASVLPSWGSRLSEVLALPVRKALARAAAHGGAEIVEKIAEKTGAQLIQKKGVVKGSIEYLKRLAQMFREGGIPVITTTTEVEDLLELPKQAIVDSLAPKTMLKILDNYVARQRKTVGILRKAMEHSKLLADNGTKNLPKTQALIEDIRTFSTQHGLKDGKTWRFIIAETEEEALQTGKYLFDPSKPYELRAALSYGYYRNGSKRGKYSFKAANLLRKGLKNILKNARAEDWAVAKRLKAERELMQDLVKMIETPDDLQIFQTAIQDERNELRGTSFPTLPFEKWLSPEKDQYWAVGAAFNDFALLSQKLPQVAPQVFTHFEARMAAAAAERRAENEARNAEFHRTRRIGVKDPSENGDFYPDDRWIPESIRIEKDEVQIIHGEVPLKPGEITIVLDPSDYEDLSD